MSETAPLCLEGITVRYGAFVAVDRLDLTIERGELFALLGPNGAGKSSTLRVLVGQIRPSAGRVLVLGRDLATDFPAIKPRFGYVPDRDGHFDELTGRQNLAFFGELYGVASPRVSECLRLVELEDAADIVVRGYSQGMRRKLLVARALLHQPELLYLDEPTANLDVHSAKLVRDVLKRLGAQGCTVLLCTHDMEEVEAICDRAAILQKGRCIALGTPPELRRARARRRVDVLFVDGTRRVFDLDLTSERSELGRLIADDRVTSLASRTSDLRAAFLEIVGETESS